MVLKIPGQKSVFKTQEILLKEESINVTHENGSIVVINEGVAITGFIQGNSVNSGIGKLKGFKTMATIHNEASAGRNVTWTVTNETQSTTLTSGSKDFADGEFHTISNFWSPAQITHGDLIRFTYGNEGPGTDAGNPVFGHVEFKIESIEETKEVT